MFEFDKYEAALHSTSAARPAAKYESVTNVHKMSLLAWSEHCIECAAPSCFQSCDLYQSRPDQRCRRFTYGMYRNTAFASLRGYGAELTFKKWAKLEARGNTRLWPSTTTLRRERALERLAPIGNFLARIANKVTRDIRYSYATFTLTERLGRWLHSHHTDDERPHAFLLEVYNPMSTPVRLQLFMSVARKEVGTHVTQVLPSFRASVTLQSGYSRHQFDARQFDAVIRSGLPFDIALIPEADTTATLVFLMADFVTFAKTTGGVADEAKPGAVSPPPNIKCVVWDLDNTIWDGVLLEREDVQPNPAVVDLIKHLDDRGILLSVVSKNTFEHAWKRLEELGLSEYFLYPQINWLPKSENIKAIAEQLNIGLDTFAFVDDNQFELDEVSRSLKMVTPVNVIDMGKLRTDPRFQGSQSADAKTRRKFYRDAMVRERKQNEFGNDFIAFLNSCEIVLEIDEYDPRDFDRVAELVQRTNQLNFSGRKYKREEVEHIALDPTLDKYVLRCSDKYGSYGTVGFSVVRRGGTEVCIEDFMLSCRVQGKFIEQAFFNFLVQGQRDAAPQTLWVNFKPTGRNTPAQQVLETLQFKPLDERAGLELDLRTHSLECPFITVKAKPAVRTSAQDSV